MKYIYIFCSIFFIFSVFISKAYSQEKSINIQCKNFIGSSVVFQNGVLDIGQDGLAGQIINISLPVPANPGNSVKINWSGGRNKMDVEGMVMVSSPDSWISFIQVHPSVVRTYTFYYPKEGMFSLALVESQGQMMTKYPEVRTYFGTCTLS